VSQTPFSEPTSSDFLTEPIAPTLREEKPCCPLCGRVDTFQKKTKKLYNHDICSKCYYSFANRRQLAYFLDAVCWTLLMFPLSMGFFFLIITYGQLLNTPAGTALYWAIVVLVGLFFSALFALKDGFAGHSPFKALLGVQVVDNTSFLPISFQQSFKRNIPFMGTTSVVGNIPVLGGLAALGIIIAIAVQLCKGHRWGDKWANTRVVWKKYAASPVFTLGHHCSGCGYDLRATTQDHCPECGHLIEPAKQEYIRRLFQVDPSDPKPLSDTFTQA